MEFCLRAAFIMMIMVTISLFIFFLYNQSCVKISIISKIDCRLSLFESDNFICEPDDVWNERKNIYQTQDKQNMMKHKSKFFFLSNWEPNFHCSHARRIGRMGDGGKWVCDPHRFKLRSDCLVYSVGSNRDFSFETQMKKIMPHCEIHTFDKKRFVCPNSTCIFHQVIFGNGTYPNGSKTWATVLKKLHHSHRKIDVLKIDIEGGEYSFFPVLMRSPIRNLPQQILVEIHRNQPNDIHTLFDLLRKHHYVIFNKEPNVLARNQFYEYAFLKLHPNFFKNISMASREK